MGRGWEKGCETVWSEYIFFTLYVCMPSLLVFQLIHLTTADFYTHSVNPIIIIITIIIIIITISSSRSIDVIGKVDISAHNSSI